MRATESLHWSARARVFKWRDEESMRADERPYEVIEHAGNVLTTAGVGRLEDLLIGAGGQAFDATHTRIGVGDGTGPASPADTDLSAAAGSGHRQFVTMDATYPLRTGIDVVYSATFLSAVGNFAWNEWCIDLGTANGVTVGAVMLNHKIASFGTKVLGEPWQMRAVVEIT